MNLKTYRGGSMAEALAEVKKDLGKDAVILHTRSFKTGAVMGVGGKQVVEITASNEPRAGGPRLQIGRPQARAAAAAGAGPEFVTETFRRVDRIEELGTATAPAVAAPAPELPLVETRSAPTRPVRPEPPRPQSRGPEPKLNPPPPAASKPVSPAERPGPRALATPVEPRPVDSQAVESLRGELAAIKGLVGQVLRATRHTALAVSTPGVGTVSAGGAAAATVLAHGGLPEPLFECFMRLQEAQVAVELGESVVGAVRNELSPGELGDREIVRTCVLRHLAAAIPTVGAFPRAGKREDGRPLTIALLGPTGVGKTTTIAKIAAMYKLRQNRRVGLVTSDTYRIAAVEQLRTYANIIGLPLKVAMTPGEMSSAVESLQGCDVVLVDTAGRSQHDRTRLGDLGDHLAAAQPHDRYLVLSATSAESVLQKAAERFGELSPSGLILTKLDEAVQFGVVPNMLRAVGVPLALVTNGQEVPDDIELANADRLARLVLDGAEDNAGDVA